MIQSKRTKVVRPALSRCERGMSMVEFALLAPVFMSILLATVQFAFVLFTYSAAQQASWAIARQVAIGTMSAGVAQQNAKGMLPSWAQSASTIPPVTLQNGLYTVSITIPVKNASPVNMLSNLAPGASLTTRATFYAETN